jgi:hypothetical protein
MIVCNTIFAENLLLPVIICRHYLLQHVYKAADFLAWLFRQHSETKKELYQANTILFI